jgi:hypothetical protein
VEERVAAQAVSVMPVSGRPDQLYH